MIIDCHYHIEEEMFPLEKMIESMNQNGIDKTALIAGTDMRYHRAFTLGLILTLLFIGRLYKCC